MPEFYIRIGDIASWIGVSRDKIKEAERKKIVVSQKTRGGHRLYSIKNVNRLNHYFLLMKRRQILQRRLLSEKDAETDNALSLYEGELETKLAKCADEALRAQKQVDRLEREVEKFRLENSRLQSELRSKEHELQTRSLRGVPNEEQGRAVRELARLAFLILSGVASLPKKREREQPLSDLVRWSEKLVRDAPVCKQILETLHREAALEPRGKQRK